MRDTTLNPIQQNLGQAFEPRHSDSSALFPCSYHYLQGPEAEKIREQVRIANEKAQKREASKS